jgi:hypothetical protein
MAKSYREQERIEDVELLLNTKAPGMEKWLRCCGRIEIGCLVREPNVAD